MTEPNDSPDLDEGAHFLRRSFNAAARGRYTIPVVLALGVLWMTVNESTYQRAHATLGNGIALTDARMQSAKAQQLLTDATLHAHAYVLSGSPEESSAYQTVVQALQEVKTNAFKNVALVDPQKTISFDEIERLLGAHLEDTGAWVDMRARGDSVAAMAQANSNTSRQLREQLHHEFERLLNQAAAIQQTARVSLYDALLTNRWAVHFLALATMLGLFLFSLQLRAGDRQLAQEGERLAVRVKERTAELAEMANHLVTAREDERGRVARELHDEMGGLLTAMKLEFARLRRQPEMPAKAVERMQAIEARLNEGIALKRRIIENLRPSALEQLGLLPALEILCQEVASSLGKPVHARLEPVMLDRAAELTVYRVAQESLTNVSKYAQCEQVVVRLVPQRGGWVQLTVTDDGCGFAPGSVGHGHHGVKGMRFRLESHGGRFKLNSAPGRGTTVTAELPAVATAPPSSTASAAY